jgi:hypothetical protein
MEALVITVIVLLVGHLISLNLIIKGYEGMVKELRMVVLEREETSRQMYADGPTTGTDDQHNPKNMVKMV